MEAFYCFTVFYNKCRGTGQLKCKTLNCKLQPKSAYCFWLSVTPVKSSVIFFAHFHALSCTDLHWTKVDRLLSHCILRPKTAIRWKTNEMAVQADRQRWVSAISKSSSSSRDYSLPSSRSTFLLFLFYFPEGDGNLKKATTLLTDADRLWLRLFYELIGRFWFCCFCFSFNSHFRTLLGTNFFKLIAQKD